MRDNVNGSMRKLFKWILFALALIILTAVTQVGGIILLLCLPLFRMAGKMWPYRRRIIYPLIFTAIYLAATFVVIPRVAGKFGRVALPVVQNENVQPLTFLTCLLNRHYVRPEVHGVLIQTASEINFRYPGTSISYLDAGFPFISGFPLLPHLSHDDGKKLDLAFLYKDAGSEELLSGTAPTFIGYGSFEDPVKGEPDMPSECEAQGYWQYGILKVLSLPTPDKTMNLDNDRTKALLLSLAANPSVEKIFIEPHLKIRLGVNSDKIRFHGCQAVRHDDHIHVQI